MAGLGCVCACRHGISLAQLQHLHCKRQLLLQHCFKCSRDPARKGNAAASLNGPVSHDMRGCCDTELHVAHRSRVQAETQKRVQAGKAPSTQAAVFCSSQQGLLLVSTWVPAGVQAAQRALHVVQLQLVLAQSAQEGCLSACSLGCYAAVGNIPSTDPTPKHSQRMRHALR